MKIGHRTTLTRITARFIPRREAIAVAVVWLGIAVCVSFVSASIGRLIAFMTVWGLIGTAKSVFDDHLIAGLRRMDDTVWRWREWLTVWRHGNPRGSTWDETQLEAALERLHRKRRLKS